MYIGKVKYGNNTWPLGSTLYGTCGTAAGTKAKVVTMEDFDELITGITIHVKFTYSNTVADPTLNVNNTGAKSIKRYGTTAPSTSASTSWNAGAVISFTYDGTYWCMNDWMNTDSNTTYSAGTGLLLSGTTFSIKTGYTTDGNNRAVQADSDGNLYVVQKDNNTWTAWKGATDSANGTAGYMPAPTIAQKNLFLRGDGSWVSLNNYSLPLAANDTRGGVQIGYTTNAANRNYAVLLSSEKMYVNVPWANNYGVDVSSYTATATNKTYYPIIHSNASGTDTSLNTSSSLLYDISTTKTSLTIGNYNQQGLIKIYGGNISGYTFLTYSGSNPNVINTLPGTTGTILNTGTTSFTQSLSSGTKIGTITIDGDDTDLYCNKYSTFVKSGSTAAAGLVPKPSTTAGTTKFLCEDGTWKLPSYTTDTNTLYYLTLNGTVKGTSGTTDLGTFYAVATSNTTTANLVWMRNSSNNGYGWRTLGSRAFDSTSYLPLAGGTMTGAITLNGLKAKDLTGNEDFNTLDDGIWNTLHDSTSATIANTPTNTSLILFKFTSYVSGTDIRKSYLVLDAHGRAFIRGSRQTSNPWRELLHTGNYSSYALPLRNGPIAGTGTIASDGGASDANRYKPAKWTFDKSTVVQTGDIFLIKIPCAGHSYGVYMSVNNGNNYDGNKTSYYPIVVAGSSRLTTHYGSGLYMLVIFDGSGSASDMFPLAGGTARLTVTGGVFRVLNYYDSGNTVPTAYCSTAAATAAKVASCSGYVLRSGNFIHVTITQSNTSQTALTLNINSTGAKPIYINGSASSTTNYTLPAGTYIVYYNGTNYYFRTDGVLTASITGNAATATTATRLPTAYGYDGGKGITNPYHLVALASITNTTGTRNITAAFLVSSHHRKNRGILFVLGRVESGASTINTSETHARWILKDDTLDPSNFIFTTKVTSNSLVCRLYYKVTNPWEHARIIRIDDGSWASPTNNWLLYNTSSDTAGDYIFKTIPSGETLLVSVDATTSKYANQLYTSRTIWGLSFNGTGNVTGALSSVGNISFDGDGTRSIGSTTNRALAVYAKNGYILDTAPAVHVGTSISNFIAVHWAAPATQGAASIRGIYDSSGGWICGYNGTNTYMTGGNVGIGTTSPSQKLEVSGTAKADSLYIKDNLITTTQGSSSTSNYFTIACKSNEALLVGDALTLYVNYRTYSGKTSFDSYKWNAGSSSTWAKHEIGEFVGRGVANIYPLINKTIGVLIGFSSTFTGPEIVLDPNCTDDAIGTGADYTTISVNKTNSNAYITYAKTHSLYVSPRDLSNPGYFNANGAWVAPSDISLKKDIYKPDKDKLHDIWEWLVQKGFKNFTWKAENKEDFGVIAQEVLEVTPNAVDYDESKELYGVDYTKLHSHAIAAIVQELNDTKEEIKQLQALIAELKLLLNN